MLIFLKGRFLLLATAVTLLFFVSCQKESVKSELNNEIIQNAKKWFNENSKAYPKIWDKNQNNLDWNSSGLFVTNDGSRYLYVPYKNLIHFETSRVSLSRQLIFKINSKNETEAANVLETFAIRTYLSANKPNLAKNYYNKTLSSFTGGIIFYDFGYNAIDRPYYRKGIQVAQTGIKMDNQIVGSKTDKTDACFAIYYGWIDWENNTFEPIYFLGVYCDVEGQGEGGPTTLEWTSWSGISQSNGPVTSSNPDLDWLINNLKDSTGNPCVDSVLNKLRQLSETIPGMLADYFGEAADFKMTFQMENVGPVNGNAPVGGHSVFVNGQHTYPVFINGYYSHATDLSLAITILHESLHCQIYDWFNSAANNPTRQQELAEQYGAIFTDVFSVSSTLTNLINGQTPAQHQAIAEVFINVMADALYAFAQARGINTDLSTCMNLAAAETAGSAWYESMDSNEKEFLAGLRAMEFDPTRITVATQNLNPNYQALGHPCN